MDYPKRKANRLSTYDYSAPGVYFITICTRDKAKILGEVVGGGALDAPCVHLTKIGETVKSKFYPATGFQVSPLINLL